MEVVGRAPARLGEFKVRQKSRARCRSCDPRTSSPNSWCSSQLRFVYSQLESHPSPPQRHLLAVRLKLIFRWAYPSLDLPSLRGG